MRLIFVSVVEGASYSEKCVCVDEPKQSGKKGTWRVKFSMTKHVHSPMQ